MTKTSPPQSSASHAAPPARVRSIQYLRAIAALWVVAYHASKRVQTSLPESINDFFHLGHGGVDLFFVISGFIMWSIGCQAPRAPGQFLLRRAIRVVPPYWIATLSWVVVMTVLGIGWIVITPAHVVQSLLFVPHWSPTFPDKFWPVLVPGWTLIFEMYFYVLFALVLLVVSKWRLAALTGVLLALVCVGLVVSPETAPMQAYTSPLLLEFLSGCLIAEAWRRGIFNFQAGVCMVIAGLLVLAFLAPMAITDQTSWSRPLTFGLAGALIVWGGVSLEDYLPDLPLLERLGDASYAIYLFHLFVVLPMGILWFAFPAVHGVVSALLFVVVAMVLASVMGLWLFKWVERPMQKRLTRMFTQRKATARPQT